MSQNHLFQALHAPIGANASFAFGLKEGGGGFGLQKDRVPEQDVFIGFRRGNHIQYFPFVTPRMLEREKSFTGVENKQKPSFEITVFQEKEIVRDYAYATDTVSAEKLRFTMMNRIDSIPEIKPENEEHLMDVLAPGLLARLEYDNTEGNTEVEVFFAVSEVKSKEFLQEVTSDAWSGVISLEGYGFAAESTSTIREFADFSLASLFSRPEPLKFYIAPMAGIVACVEPGKKLSVDIALGWFEKGNVSTGTYQTSYLYNRYFKDLKEVLRYTLQNKQVWWKKAWEQDCCLKESGLSQERQFLVAHAEKTYYVSTMLVECNGTPMWLVNEGSFMMINTFDLAVDHLFFELKQNPWVVRNQLENYRQNYSYTDQCGIAFTHDLGTHNVFTPKGKSSYEIPYTRECFSYMSAEQLCNWILCCGAYMAETNDTKWKQELAPFLEQLYESLQARTMPLGDGVMNTDSDRCKGGGEITTYDSLDPSLGQSRRSLYLAGKFIASFAILSHLLADEKGRTDTAQKAWNEAMRGCATVVSFYRQDLEYIPALLESGDESAIIPAIEGLVYLKKAGLLEVLLQEEDFGDLFVCLKKHIETVLVKGICLFDDGGFKLSKNSDNSWMSKIFLCQYIIEEILQCEYARQESDEAHCRWWMQGCASNPAIDQIFAGTQSEKGFHYPRSVTNTLWW